MRILVVSNGFPPRGKWGTEFYTRELVVGLAGRGHAVEVLHPERSGTRPRYTLETVREAGVPVHLLHNPGDPRKRFADAYENEDVERAFGALLERARPDVVHFTYLLWGLSARLPLVARERGVPSVVTLTDYGLLCHRGQMFDHRLRRCFGPHPPEVCARCVRTPSRYDAPLPGRVARRAATEAVALAGGLGRVPTRAMLARRERRVREALAAVERFVAPTAVLADAFAGWGVPRERIERLVYAFDDRPLHAARIEPRGDQVRLGFLGQFTPHKGLGTLLRAVRRMEHRLPESLEPWVLRLYGQPAGGRHRLFASRVLGPAAGPRVEVHPPFEPEELPRVLADLHAVVLPSEWDENAPLTVLQARAAGVPVVASDVPGVAEVLEHGVHGLLAPPGDALALADALREVVLRRLGRLPDPGLPLSLAAHLDRIEALHAEVVGVAPTGA